MFHVLQFEKCLSMLDKYFMLDEERVADSKDLQLRKKYCEILVGKNGNNNDNNNDNTNSRLQIGTVAVKLAEGCEEECFEAWYNNKEPCKNMKITRLVSLMQIAEMPIVLLLQYIDKQKHAHVASWSTSDDVNNDIVQEFQPLINTKDEIMNCIVLHKTALFFVLSF